MAWLELRTDVDQPRRDLNDEQTVLGRYPFCEVVIKHTAISRQHARIVRKSQGFFVEDMNSLNGTFLNGQRVFGLTRLSDEDSIHLYEVPVVFHDDSPGKTDATPAGSSAAPVRKETVLSVETGAAPEAPSVTDEAAKLSAVLEVHRKLAGTLDVDELLEQLLDGLISLFPQTERGYILFPEPDDGQLALRVIRQGGDKTDVAGTLGPLDEETADRVMKNGEAILSVDEVEDGVDPAVYVLDYPVRSLMAAPLSGPLSGPLGVVCLDTNDYQRPFGNADLEVLLSVAAIAGQSIEFTREHEANLKTQIQKQELATAREVQLQYLPSAPPQIEGYEFFDYYSSAAQVGGDYYGFVPLDAGRWAVVVADVSGKGVSAALVMARLSADVRYCLAASATLVEAIELLNRQFCEPNPGSRFVTCCICVLDPIDHTLGIVNAGHMPPIRRSRASGSIESLGASQAGIPIGFERDVTYQRFETKLDSGDCVILYTDGINEAMSNGDEVFGVQRLEVSITQGPATPDQLGPALLGDVNRFVNGLPQHDDTCLVILGRDP